MKKVKLIPPPYQYDKIKTDYGDSGLKFDLEQKSKSGKSMFGYLIVAIIGALFCLLTLNALGWKKQGKANFIQIKPDKEIILSEKQMVEIQQFRPAVRDVAYYILLHKDKLRLDEFRLHCGRFSLWVGNEAYGFDICEPIEIEFTNAEKTFFWEIYTDFRDKELRLYNWESEAKITVK